jgi:hypothetical protein
MGIPYIANSLAMAALFALAGFPWAANATVVIKTFQFAICVAGAKHPDACKNVDADAHVVVSDETMEDLDGRIGQGATIEAVPGKGAESPSSGHERRHRRQEQQ